MSYSIQDVGNDLQAVLHNTQLNQITNLFGLYDRAARNLLLDLDPQETKRTQEFIGPVFNTVFDYPIATDVKGNKIIDIFPQVQRLPLDIWGQQYNQAFDVTKQNVFTNANSFTMSFNTGLKTIRINAPYLNPPVIVNQIEAISTNGTWTTGGTASNLSVNNTNFVQGAGSLQFNVTSGAAYLENSTMTAVNLSAVVNQAYLFVNASVPTGTNLTSVNLRFGSSSSNYYTLTVTQNQQGNAFVNGWNQEQFIWANMTTVGSPNSSAITYARITLNVTATMTGCLLNGLNSILGTILSYEYYSKYLFRNASTGAFQENVLDSSDLVNLDTESYNIFFSQVAYLAAQQQQGIDASFNDGPFFLEQYQQGVQRYRSMYKSEVQKPQTSFYAVTNQKYNRFGRNWGY